MICVLNSTGTSGSLNHLHSRQERREGKHAHVVVGSLAAARSVVHMQSKSTQPGTPSERVLGPNWEVRHMADNLIVIGYLHRAVEGTMENLPNGGLALGGQLCPC
jgi:hypothetical protein